MLTPVQTHIVADIKCPRHPITRDTLLLRLNPRSVLCRRPALHVHITRQSRLVFRVANQKNALDGCVGFTTELGQGVDGGCGALGVAFEDKAFICVFGEGVADVFYDLDVLVIG